MTLPKIIAGILVFMAIVITCADGEDGELD